MQKEKKNKQANDIDGISSRLVPDRPQEEDKDAGSPGGQDVAEAKTKATQPEIVLSQFQDDDMQNAPSRPTRRQRAVVSYAEPNLRDKMRRPTGELRDAVDNHSRRSSSSQADRATTRDDNEESGMGRTSMKSSRISGFSDKDSSSLSVEASEDPSKSPMHMVSQRKRKTLPANKNDSVDVPSFADDAAETNPAVREKRASELNGSAADLEGETERGGQGTQSAVIRELSTKVHRTTSRQSRRHSSNPRPSEQAEPFPNTYPESSLSPTVSTSRRLRLSQRMQDK
jgi:hypothetical protein